LKLPSAATHPVPCQHHVLATQHRGARRVVRSQLN
jgi:hypothetical protein